MYTNIIGERILLQVNSSKDLISHTICEESYSDAFVNAS